MSIHLAPLKRNLINVESKSFLSKQSIHTECKDVKSRSDQNVQQIMNKLILFNNRCLHNLSPL